MKHLRAIALQIAAAEEQKGHLKFAEEIKKLISELPFSKYKEFNPVKLEPVPVVQPTGELKGLLNVEYSEVKLNNLIFSDELRTRINRLITEYKCKNELRAFNLLPRSKVLLIGAPGTGKTMTAKALGEN